MATFQSGGFNLAYDDIPGSGAGTVVLVHGFATNRDENWRRLGWLGAFERKGYRQFADNQGDDKLALAACSEGLGEPLDLDELYRLSMPVLVVAGVFDKLAGDPQALADAIPGAKAVTLPGVDHFSAIPHALFKASVFDFLEGWMDDDLPTFE